MNAATSASPTAPTPPSARPYPVRLEAQPPEGLSPGLWLVKWWLLAIPHYVVVGLLTGPQMQWRDGDGMVRYSTHIGLIGILVLVGGFTLLFVGRYPRGLHDLLMGLNRWAYRVGVYVSLMTDQYPPFRLDMGAKEPGLPSGSPAEGGDAV